MMAKPWGRYGRRKVRGSRTSARWAPGEQLVVVIADQSRPPELRGSPGSVAGSWNIDGWSRDGRELFYRSLGERRKLMAVAVDTRGGRLRLGPPQPMFDDTFLLGAAYTHADYDVAPDGRFIFVEDPPEAPAPHQIVLIPGWGNELREKLRAASR